MFDPTMAASANSQQPALARKSPLRPSPGMGMAPNPTPRPMPGPMSQPMSMPNRMPMQRPYGGPRPIMPQATTMPMQRPMQQPMPQPMQDPRIAMNRQLAMQQGQGDQIDPAMLQQRQAMVADILRRQQMQNQGGLPLQGVPQAMVEPLPQNMGGISPFGGRMMY